MSKSPILYNIYWGKFNILPTTLLRTKWYTTSIFRLPRHIYEMKCSIFIWSNNFIRSTPYIYFYNLRGTSRSTTSNCYISHTIIHRMRRYAPTRIPHLDETTVITYPINKATDTNKRVEQIKQKILLNKNIAK